MTGKAMFAAEYEPAQLGRRRSVRAPVSFDAKLGRGGLDRALCRVIDLSRHGVRLQTYSALQPGAVIWLTLPLLGPVAATVVWEKDFVCGCQFQEALAQEDFDALLERDQSGRGADDR